MSIHTILDPHAAVILPPKRCALGIMTKAPRPGEVKTRLIPPLTPTEAAQLNTNFIRDISCSISLAARESASRGVAVYTPRGSEANYEDILPADFLLLPQRGNLFGERLLCAAEDLFKVGFESVCLINSDSPTVAASSFVQAANELARSGDRIVIGPAADGGYYLIGLKKFYRRLFEEIDWSTERVLDQTLKRVAEIGLDVKMLPIGYDVDDRLALQRLCDELLDKNASEHAAPSTRSFLKEIIDREGRARICLSTKT